VANIFNRLWSKADFWDKKENAQQQAQFDQEDEEERKRRQAAAARQSVTATGVPQPGTVIKPVSAPAATPSLTIGSQSDFSASQPLQKAQPKQPLPDQEFKGLETVGQKNKTIFGWNAAALLPKSLEKVDQVKTGVNLTTNKDKYVAGFDKLDDERKKLLVNDAQQRAKQGDAAAQNTVRALQETGRLKGNAEDFIEGANDKLYGGLNRAAARTIELLPGDQGAGKWADADAATNKQYTTAGKVGERVGSVEKGVVDLATIALPGAKIDKLAEASKAYQLLSNGNKVMKIGGQLVKVAPGSLAGTGIDALQTNGRGDDVDIVKSGATGLATDVGVSALPLGIGKLAKFLRRGTDDGGAEQGVQKGYSIFSKLRKLASNTNANLNEAEQLQPLEKEVVSSAQEAAPVPGRSTEDRKEAGQPEEPTVELAPGIKSTNLAKADAQPEPTQVATAQGNVIDRGTDLKIGELMDQTDGVPVEPGMKRLYQGTENGVPTDWHFDNVDDLARYFSNRSDNVDFSYRDVPENQAVQQANRGNGVYRVAENTTNEPANIPDPANPIALAKAGDSVPPAEVEQNVADFSRAVDGSQPLQKVPPTTAEGNEGLQSDAVAMRQAAEAGELPQNNPNAPAPEVDQTAANAEQAAAEQVNSSTDAAAPRTRGRAANMIQDQDLRQEVLDNFPQRQTLNIADTENRAIQDINNMTDGELISSLPNNVMVDSPEDFIRTVNSIRRLESIGTPEAQDAIANAVNALTDFSARSGRNLRTTQILFDDMPVALKVKTLEKQLNKAGADLDETQMQMLTTLVTRADAATDNLRSLEDEARALLDSGSINNGSLAPETTARVAELSKQIEQARASKELLSGEAWRYWQQQMPPGPIGKRIGDVGRTLMLSSPTGRVFDIGSTAATAADDTLTRGVSNLIGKGLNKIAGAGTVQDTLPDVNATLRGLREGIDRTGQAFKGNDYVEDVLGEVKRGTRGDVNTGGGKIRQLIRTGVELPTNLTRGLRTDQLYREGMQEAAGIGLTGEARRTYAQLRAAVPSEQQLNEAVQVHMRANMLHDNGISRALNNVANSLDQKGGGWAAPFIRNQVMPFTSWLGGNLHRTLTDKNVLWNVGSAISNATKGNAQGVVDDIAKLAVNTGEAYAAGMLLTQAGIVTTQDANGDSYGGLYFHIGDRYIPVAAAGTVAIPLILGNGIQQAYDVGEKGGNTQEVVSAFVNSAGLNTLKNAGVASVFGGDNNLQSSVDAALREGGDLVNGAAQFGGNIVRQYIPSLASDINAGLDQTNLNPTHETAETKVTNENPETGRQVTDVLGTEVNKTLNKIPFASQNLDRKPDTASKDLIDRITKGDRETGTQADDRVRQQSLKEIKAQLVRDKVPIQSEAIKAAMDDGDYEKARRGLDYQIVEEQSKPDPSESKIKKLQDQRAQADMGERGVPFTDDGIKARTEDGDYDKAIEGLQYQLQKAQGDKNTPKSKLKQIQDSVMRLRVANEKEYAPSTIAAYAKTSNSEWRSMGDPRSEDYDPDMYNLLAQYDADLAANGVSASTKDGSKPKYYNSKGSGKGGGDGIGTDIGTNRVSFDSNFTPIKAKQASSSDSTVPILAKAKNNDRSKLKKISVSRGGM
jgi:hypothetical protein